MSSDKQSSNQRNGTSSLEIEISALASLIASTTTIAPADGDRMDDPQAVGEEKGDELGAEEVEELMRRMETANGIADGVEGKLDGILEHLDVLLRTLEARGEAKEKDSTKIPQPGQ